MRGFSRLALAARIEAAADDDNARVDTAYRLAYGRRPDDDEREFVLAYLRSAPNDPADRLTPWQRVAQALLVANEIAWLP